MKLISDKTQDDSGDARRDAEARRLHTLRMEALSAGPGRNALYDRHPIVKNKLWMITPPIKKIYDVAERVIVHHIPGTCIVGGFRMGKTWASECLRAEFSKTFPDIPSHILVAKDHLDPNEAEFYGDLLEDYRHGAARSGKAGHRKKRLFALWEAAARAKGNDRYLLYIDEGQNWKEQELTWLRDMANVMEKRNVELQTLMFAHSWVVDRRAKLLDRRRTDLIGRFLLTLHEFSGIQGPTDLAVTFAILDDPSQHSYPEGSGIALSQFFLPKAYENGWRLESEAAACWAAMVEVASRSGHVVANVGMQWVMGPIRNFLFAHVEKESAVFTGSHDAWLLAVEASEFEASLDGDLPNEE